MDVWGWIAVYAVGLTLLQLLVYRYLLNSGGSLTRRVGSPFGDHEGDRDTSWVDGSSSPTNNPNSPRPSGDHDGNGSGGRDSSPATRGLDTRPQVSAGVTHPPGSDSPQTDGRPCRHCGAVNELDTTFTRCWNCTQEL